MSLYSLNRCYCDCHKPWGSTLPLVCLCTCNIKPHIQPNFNIPKVETLELNELVNRVKKLEEANILLKADLAYHEKFLQTVELKLKENKKPYKYPVCICPVCEGSMIDMFKLPIADENIIKCRVCDGKGVLWA